MPKNILVDLNVILDVLLERAGHQASQSVLELQQTRGYTLFISGHTVTTFAYLLEYTKVPQPEIRRHVDWLLQTFSVVSTNVDILKDALKSPITDYEDAVIEQAALACKSSLIITRNIKDFRLSVVSAITPESFAPMTTEELSARTSRYIKRGTAPTLDVDDYYQKNRATDK